MCSQRYEYLNIFKCRLNNYIHSFFFMPPVSSTNCKIGLVNELKMLEESHLWREFKHNYVQLKCQFGQFFNFIFVHISEGKMY